MKVQTFWFCVKLAEEEEKHIELHPMPYEKVQNYAFLSNQE